MMKLLLLALLFVSRPTLADGQMPPIGIIDFYGLRHVSEQRVRQALQIKEGDSLPELREGAVRRLEDLPEVQQAHLAAVCCAAGRTILFVGIKEKGSPSFRFRSMPRGSVRLPQTIRYVGEALDGAITAAVRSGQAFEDYSQGHALDSDPKVRSIQERFIAFAAQDLKLLRAVLRTSADGQDRALAAEIIGYSANKREVVKDLVYGVSDPDGGVRNNSMRALAVIAGFAQRSPKLRIKVPIEPFIDMLNSLEWTDRNKSSFALFELTEKRDPAVLAKLRETALVSLVEMSRWKSPGHAFRPFVLLGRVGGFSEAEIHRDWDNGNRKLLIEKVLSKFRSK